MGELQESNVERVVLISGPIASGKSTLGRLLADRFGYCVVSTRDLLAQQGSDRRSFQAAGATLDYRTAGRWVRDRLVESQAQSPGQASFVVDSVRTLDQIRWVRKAYDGAVLHVHLTAKLEILSRRYGFRFEGYNYEDVRDDPTERRIERLRETADLVIDTTGRSPDTVLGIVASHLGLNA